MSSLSGRSFLTLKDLSGDEINSLVDTASTLKAAKKSGRERQHLRGKNLALIFEKTSTRTRSGFEVAAFDQGAHVSYIGPHDSQLGHKETIKDTARVLGRMYDGIEFRGFSQAEVETLAAHASVPVWNGLTDEYHPTQTIADFLTMQEHAGTALSEVELCFVGDARNNVARSLMIGAAKVGMGLRMAAPRRCWPDANQVRRWRDVARGSSGSISVTEDLGEAVRGCEFVYTDVWVSMGEPEATWAERIRLLEPYRVTRDVMKMSGNARVKFMHCLPAFHSTDTEVGRHVFDTFGLSEMEVTDDVFESDASIVFDQAENRMHTIKALLVTTLGDEGTSG